MFHFIGSEETETMAKHALPILFHVEKAKARARTENQTITDKLKIENC